MSNVAQTALLPADHGPNAPTIADWDSPMIEVVPPTKVASPALIADHLARQEMDREYRLTDLAVVQFCSDLGVEPFPVLSGLEPYRDGSDSYSLDDVTFTVDKAAFAQLRADGKTSCCPIPDWDINVTSGRQSYRLHDCESLRCPEHSLARVEAQLERAREEFDLRSDIWYAETSYSDQVLARIRSRRRPNRGGGGIIQVRRADGRLLCFATRELPGADEPNNWVRLSPEEAYERFAAGLALPGIAKVRWSNNGWVTTRTSEPPSKTGGSGDWIDLPAVRGPIRDEARQIAADIAWAKWGVRPDEDGFPADIADPRDWADLLKFGVVVARQRLQAPSSF